MQQSNTRLWWMEVLRGIVAISFGLMFTFIDVRFFIYALGICTLFTSIGKRVIKRREVRPGGTEISNTSHATEKS